MATEKSDFDPNQDSTTDWPPLNDARLLLHRRGLLLEQLFKLCSHAVRGRVGQSRVPLFDCFIIVTLNVDGDSGNIPRVKLKYPEEAELPHGIEMLCFPDSEVWTPKPLDQCRRIGDTYYIYLTLNPEYHNTCSIHFKTDFCLVIIPTSFGTLNMRYMLNLCITQYQWLPLDILDLTTHNIMGSCSFKKQFSIDSFLDWEGRQQILTTDVEITALGRTYSLVLTDLNGKRKFGYCRRILPEGGNMTLPLVYCIISSKRAYNLYNQILRELEREHGCNKDQENEMLRLLYSQSFPAVGKPVFISHSGKIVKKVRRPLDARLDQPNFLFLLRCLGIQGISKVFVTMLLERKMIVTGNCLLTLSKAIECLTSLLAPFDWQHLLVPVLPQSLGHLVDAPTPYIIGILSTGMLDSEIVENFSEGMILQLDSYPVILKECGDELANIPEALLNPLENQLSLVDLFSKEADAFGRHGSPAHNILIFEAFTKFLLALVGDTSKFLRIKNGKRSFNLKGYLSNCCESNMPLLQTFASTAMFTCYIDEKLLAFYTLKRFEGGSSKLLTDLESDDDHPLKFETGVKSQSTTFEEFSSSNSVLPYRKIKESSFEQISQNVPQPSIIRSNFKVNAYNEIGVSIILLNTEKNEDSDGVGKHLTKRYLYLSPDLNFKDVLDCIKKVHPDKKKFLINGSISPSSFCKLIDLYNVFKKEDDFLHLMEV